jgi:hypothetical protein
VALQTDRWRTKEQVLVDLSKALSFSAASLESNRTGKLSAEQWSSMFGRFLREVLGTAAWLVGPFGIWSLLIAYSRGISLPSAVQTIFTLALHPKEMFGDGWMKPAFCIVATLACIGVGFWRASRISFGLYFDLLERAVVSKEGRVEAREDQVFRKSGRDPIEKYYFDMKDERFVVNLQAFRAIEQGAAYRLYVLPRSRKLIAIEPRVDG